MMKLGYSLFGFAFVLLFASVVGMMNFILLLLDTVICMFFMVSAAGFCVVLDASSIVFFVSVYMMLLAPANCLKN